MDRPSEMVSATVPAAGQPGSLSKADDGSNVPPVALAWPLLSKKTAKGAGPIEASAMAADVCVSGAVCVIGAIPFGRPAYVRIVVPFRPGENCNVAPFPLVAAIAWIFAMRASTASAADDPAAGLLPSAAGIATKSSAAAIAHATTVSVNVNPRCFIQSLVPRLTGPRPRDAELRCIFRRIRVCRNQR